MDRESYPSAALSSRSENTPGCREGLRCSHLALRGRPPGFTVDDCVCRQGEKPRDSPIATTCFCEKCHLIRISPFLSVFFLLLSLFFDSSFVCDSGRSSRALGCTVSGQTLHIHGTSCIMSRESRGIPITTGSMLAE